MIKVTKVTTNELCYSLSFNVLIVMQKTGIKDQILLEQLFLQKFAVYYKCVSSLAK